MSADPTWKSSALQCRFSSSQATSSPARCRGPGKTLLGARRHGFQPIFFLASAGRSQNLTAGKGRRRGGGGAGLSAFAVFESRGAPPGPCPWRGGAAELPAAFSRSLSSRRAPAGSSAPPFVLAFAVHMALTALFLTQSSASRPSDFLRPADHAPRGLTATASKRSRVRAEAPRLLRIAVGSRVHGIDVLAGEKRLGGGSLRLSDPLPLLLLGLHSAAGHLLTRSAAARFGGSGSEEARPRCASRLGSFASTPRSAKASLAADAQRPE